MPLLPNTLWVVEQIPTLVVADDLTTVLQFGYWPSYNIPFFPQIFQLSGMPILPIAIISHVHTLIRIALANIQNCTRTVSIHMHLGCTHSLVLVCYSHACATMAFVGYPEIVSKFGISATHQLAPRAQIFRRDQATVVDFPSLLTLMRSNSKPTFTLYNCIKSFYVFTLAY